MSKPTASHGCLRALARLLLIMLLALTTSAFLFETFLAHLNARTISTALVAEAGTQLLTPNLTSQDVVKSDYQDMQNQVAAQPNGSAYFPFVRVAIPAREVTGKSIADVLRAVYSHLAGAYYVQSGFDGIFGFTPPQLKQYAPQIAATCPLVLKLPDTASSLPPGVDLSFILTAISGQNGSNQSGPGGQGSSGTSSGNGSGATDPQAQQQALLTIKLGRIVCASIERGGGLSSADLSNILSVIRTVVSTSGSNGASSDGSNIPNIPQIPNLAHNPALEVVGMSIPLSANAEQATTLRQILTFVLSLLLALLIVLLSSDWGRLANVAVGMLLGGVPGLAVVIAVSQVWSRNATQLQQFATLGHLIGDTFTVLYTEATILGLVGVLAAIVGTITTKVMAGRVAAVSANTRVGGVSQQRVPVAVPARASLGEVGTGGLSGAPPAFGSGAIDPSDAPTIPDLPPIRGEDFG